MKKQYGAWILIGFGLFMLLGFASGGGSRGLIANIMTFLLLVVAPLGGGIMLLHFLWNRRQQFRPRLLPFF